VGISVNSIPSINLPFTDNKGRISPVWHEFLRKFVADATENEDADSETTNVIAGAGLTKDSLTLAVGAGSGIQVNDDDVNVDITNQTYIQAELDDEVMVADRSDNNAIRKTKLRDLAALAGNPGGDSFQVQYNSDGIFEGDSGMTTNGEGSVDIVGDLDVDNINLDGNTISTTSGNLNWNPSGYNLVQKNIELDTNIYIYGSNGIASNGPRIALNSTSMTFSAEFAAPQVDLVAVKSPTAKFRMNLGNSGNIDFVSDDTGIIITNGGNRAIPLRRSTEASITASTTQTQGQLALVADINEVSTVANANDVVTLPVALSGRFCLVINNGANTLQVFPASGDDLGAGVNTSTTIASGSRKLFISFDATNWEPVL
jgi:hypothetical protein